MKKKKGAEVKSIIVCCVMADGTVYPVDMRAGDASKIYGYVKHIHGGRVKLREEPAIFAYDTPRMRGAIAEMEGQPGGMRKFWQRFFGPRRKVPVSEHRQDADATAA